MKKIPAILLTSMLTLGMCACTPSADVPTTAPPKPDYVGGTYVQYSRARDYTYSWWPEGTGVSERKPFCVQTGWYGLSISSVNGMLTRLGAISEEYSQSQALSQHFSVISSLPEVSADCSVSVGGESYHYTGAITPAPNSSTKTRMIESGQYMQSFDAAAMNFASSQNKLADFVGRTEYKASPAYLSVNFEIFSQTALSDAELRYSMTFAEDMEAVSAGPRRILLKGQHGGLAILLPNENASLQYDAASRTLQFSCVVSVKKQTFGGFGAILIPSSEPSEALFENYDAIAGLKVSAVQTAPKEGREADTAFDANRGVWTVDTDRMVSASGSQFSQEKYRNAYDGLKFTIENPSEQTVPIPLLFYKKRNFAVEGFAPMLRDAETGEPLGVPVQISKNWHPYDASVTQEQWYKGLDGKWYSGFTYLEIPAGKSVTYEYINAYNQWGTVNLASHSQLCLIGWPAGHTHQIWHTSTIGSSGEAFCYDPDQSCGLAFINDVRGIGFDPYENGGKYVWGANNGGGNFLYYGKDGRNPVGSNEIVGLKNVKVFYKTYGPNLSEVIFKGITQDEAVEFTFTTCLGRTNDVSRATHTFEYRFVKDVSFERMAFYQLGADNHNSGRWHGLTIGNDEGPIEYEIAGVRYGAEAEIPVSETAGYVGGAGMQQIEVPGTGLWAAFTDSYKKINSDSFNSKNAARMVSLLFFDATLNGKNYTKPSVSLRSTEMFCGASTLVELNPPAEVGKTIQAGSTVKGAVEYINLPVSLKSYYYDSEIIKNIPAEEFDTWRLAYRYAIGDKTQVSAEKGEVLRQYPIAVKCEQGNGEVAAQITVKGGISYIPLTFTNVPSYSGYRLEKLENDAWTAVDQSVIGNDYWQTYYNAESGSYELTFNVEHSGDPQAQYSYRLVRAKG